LALFNHITIGAEVIYEDYRGNVSVFLYNHSEKPYIVCRCAKIAQFICEKIYYPVLDLVKNWMTFGEVTNDLDQLGRLIL